MKTITITINETPDGGAFVEMDHSPQELIDEIDAGRGTTTMAMALSAFSAMLVHAESYEGGIVDTGDLPTRTH